MTQGTVYTIQTDNLTLHLALAGLQSIETFDESQGNFDLYINAVWYFLDFIDRTGLDNVATSQLEELESILVAKLAALQEQIAERGKGD